MIVRRALGISLFVITALSPCGSVAADSGDALAEEVTIRRDTYGVPHILAKTEEAAAFAMGYAQAEDHCVELARRLVSARGEEAKYTGMGAETDFFGKHYGAYESARTHFTDLSPLMQRMVNAYAVGVNRYVAQHRKELPAWIPTFEGVDVVARGRLEGFRTGFNKDGGIAALQRKYPTKKKADTDVLFTEPEYAEGSNMWSISGSRTTSGKPILLGNPHVSWSKLFYEAHVRVPGKINFYGSTFVGRAVLTTGFNEHLGWTHTTNNIDLDTFYALTLDPKQPESYLFDGKSMPFTKKEVAVEIKGKDGALDTQKRTYWYSHLGPIVHRTPTKVFALKSPIYDKRLFHDGNYAMSKATSWTEFHALVKKNRLLMLNIGYADVDGNTFYLWNGLLPKRLDDGTNYKLDVPGDTGKYVWTEYHDIDDYPQLFNPKGGYIQNCNAAPWWTSLRDPLDPKKYPSYLEAGVPNYFRSQMSLQMLHSQEKFSIEDVMRLRYNPKILLADRVKPDLIKAIKQTPQPSDDLKSGLAVLEAWDNRVAADSRGGVLFQRFWNTYNGALKRPYAVGFSKEQPIATQRGLSDAALAVKHLEEAVRWTRKTFGAENVKWGEVHRIRLGDLDLPASGASGSYGVFPVLQYGTAPDGKRVAGTIERGKPLAGFGDGFFFVAEFSRPVKAYSMLVYGQTSNPASKHCSDQAILFARGQFKPVRFTEADIKANLEREYRP